MTAVAVPKKAFVPAAGRGARMRPLTDHCPKPLLTVGGRTMLDRALDMLHAAGVEEAVVNACYLGDMIADHVAARGARGLGPRITLSREEELLETGGGVKKMLNFFGDAPFYVFNSDVVCLDGPTPVLSDLARAWDGDRMDCLLLLHTTQDLPAYAGRGDYYLADDSTQPVFRTRSAVPANYIFTGTQIIHPRLFKEAPEGPFSLVELFHAAEKQGRLFAHRHDGEWHHVGNPEALAATNVHLAAR